MEELFPASDLAERRAFLEALWSLEDLPRPGFQINVADQSPHNSLERFRDKRKMLEAQLGAIRAKLGTGICDDYVPALFPYLGVTVFPSAFGCQLRLFEDQQPWAEPILFDEPQQVYNLEPPRIDAGQLGDVLDYARFFMAETNGEYPLRVTDIQGPLDVAYLIWHNEDFMVAMFEHPTEGSFS